MPLITPELLNDVCTLSQGPLLVGIAAGIALTFFGWWGHRFWIVLLATVGAGVFGLNEAGALHTPPLVASLLLAMTAGMLALALVRVLAFLASGVAGLALIQSLFPSFQQPLVSFLVVGLLGLLLFRPCIVALTSYAGSVVLCYAGLGFLNLHGLDANTYIEKNQGFVNSVAGLIILVGFVFQLLAERLRRRRRREKDEDEESEGWRLLPFLNLKKAG